MMWDQTRNFYSLNQSPIFCLRSRKKLAQILGLSLTQLEVLANGGTRFYRIYDRRQPNGKVRPIEWLGPLLLKVCRRLTRLLMRIEAPGYLFSGIRGKSYVANAAAHAKDAPIAKIDVRKFFPSASSTLVYKLFYRKFLCSPDVASILCKLVTINGHLPTGSPTSVIISFYTYKEMFDEIYELAKATNLEMTLCVDDLTFSGAAANRAFLYKVGGIIKRYGLNAHKRHCFKASEAKIVTGVVITQKGLRLPNSRRKKIFDSISAFNMADSPQEKLMISKSTLGRLSEASQIEKKRFLNTQKFLRNRVRELGREVQ